MNGQTLTHKDLAKLLGVSETTVKSYRRKFPGCIPVANQGKPIRFTEEAAAVALRIRDLFSTGMSVEDVRARLAAEFAFIGPEPEKNAPAKKDAQRAASRTREQADASPELATGVSNMAKSMVAMTQQQKALLSRMQAMEELLEELGLRQTGEQAAGEDENTASGPRAAAARQREALLEERLNSLDTATAQLSQNIQGIAERLEQLLGRRTKAAEEWKDKSADVLAEAAAVAESVTAPQEKRAGKSAVVIPLRPGTTPDRSTPEQAMAKAAQRAGVDTQAGENQTERLSEPPRGFLALPLVVRTEQGQYASAGGRSRGRFSLNDLKAMLIYGFMPPNHFTLRWEAHGQGWWLFLEQAGEDGRAIALLLMELPTQKGGSVAEILQLKHNGTVLHPVEVCSIIDSFAS